MSGATIGLIAVALVAIFTFAGCGGFIISKKGASAGWFGIIPLVLCALVSVVILNAREADEMIKVRKIENIGFNYLYRGEKKSTGETCFFRDSTDHDSNPHGLLNRVDVFWCEEKAAA